MLVLSRKTGERIHIGDHITIEVRRVAGNRVTLAFDAPRNLRILRGELEQAASDFRPSDEPQPPEYAVTHHRLSVQDALAPPEVARDFVI